MHISKRAKLGHPQDKEGTDAILEVASFVEENDEITLNDPISHMEDHLETPEHAAYN